MFQIRIKKQVLINYLKYLQKFLFNLAAKDQLNTTLISLFLVVCESHYSSVMQYREFLPMSYLMIPYALHCILVILPIIFITFSERFIEIWVKDSTLYLSVTSLISLRPFKYSIFSKLTIFVRSLKILNCGKSFSTS